MKNLMVTLSSRLVAGFSSLALLAAVGLFASRPAHTAGGPVPVAVTNVPLPTHPTDETAPNQPFQTTLQPFSDNYSSASDSFTVPAHKRLVIEFVSALITQSPSGGAYSYLETTAGGTTVGYDLADSSESPARRTQVVRVYADPGSTVTVGVSSYDNSTSVGTDTKLSGYYVDVP